MDPLELLKHLANSSLVISDPNGTIKILKEITIAWEKERGSHDASIDILQDEIVELNRDIANRTEDKIYKNTGGEDNDD